MNPEVAAAKRALRHAALNVETATTALHPDGLERAHTQYLAAWDAFTAAKASHEAARWTP